MISLIVAMDRNRAIGRDGGIPWRLSADMQFFKSVTMGKPIIMGRKTWESLGRPLPGRHNIVITRNQAYQAEGATVTHSVEEALEAAAGDDEVMVIGGAAIYRLFLPLAQQLYLTRVDAEVSDADTWFPELDESDWIVLEEQRFNADEKNESGFRIQRLQRSQA